MESKMEVVKNYMKKLALTYLDAADQGFEVEHTFLDRVFYPMLVVIWTLCVELAASFLPPEQMVLLKSSIHGVFVVLTIGAMIHHDKQIETLEHFMFGWKIAFDLTVFSGVFSLIGNHFEVLPQGTILWTVGSLVASMIPIIFLIGVIRTSLLFPKYALDYGVKHVDEY